jgi:hypothetical protein
MSLKDNNIIFSIEEEESNTKFDMDALMGEIEIDEMFDDFNLNPISFHYRENFTIKELFLICDYYGIGKDLKTKKCKKEIIVKVLVDFESNNENNDIVAKRKTLWYYINELKNDKFMKKYILWQNDKYKI